MPITFLLLDRTQGRVVALSTSILLTLWPDHIWFAQVTRFYIVVAFFSYLSFLFGALAIHRRSVPLAILACGLIFASTLSHTVTVLLLGVIFAGLLAATIAERQPIPWKMVLVFVGSGVVMALYLAFYALPLLRGWNQTEEWGYSSAHAMLAAVNMIGWPTSLLACLGLLVLLSNRNAMNWYWATCGLASGAIYFVLPKLVTYQPSYAFPFVLPLLVWAGTLIASVYEDLKKTSVLTGVAWVAVSCLMGMPSLMSYYQDGSRPDYRTAGRYVNERWIEGDRGASFAIGTLKHYAPKCDALVPLKLETAKGDKETTETLEKLTQGKGRFWFVVTSPRGGLPENLRNWLGRHCSHELTVRRRRFDYLEWSVDVYLYSPKPSPSVVASADKHE